VQYVKTAVGLFENPSVADQVVHDLEASAFPRGEIRILGEPRDMGDTGIMGTPHTDFEVGMNREIQAIGASEREAKAYVRGMRRGESSFSRQDRTQRWTRRLRS